ncbi:MAG: class I SAM-dependent methyltransferase [Theionarchaea archaeon]|nr:class I SAM-dependent methyltransferase [Theionarchaea archaeon]
MEHYRQLGEKAGTALEIGVGTGRVALELARVDVEVWGIDNSPAMLNIAESNIKRLPARTQEKIRIM